MVPTSSVPIERAAVPERTPGRDLECSLSETAAEIYFWGRVTGQCILRGLYQPCHPGVDDAISIAIARPVLSPSPRT